jgi:transketolase
MEGVASEAASLAGHLKLDNLVYVYDDNQITIEGKTALAFSEDVGRRFEAYGWFVQWIDGHNLAEIERAYQAADAEAERPSLIVARTHIAHGAPHLHDSAKSHGEALGQEEVDATKAALGWPADQQFYVPDEVRELFAARRAELAQAHAAWNELFARYPQEFPEEAALWDAMHGPVPPDLTEQLLAAVDLKDDATRNHSGVVLQTAAALLPGLIGGSADLAPSTKTLIKDAGDIEAGSFGARNLHFGIREHAMASMLNGMALYGGLIPYGATFLIFSDYMRPSIRLAALMGIRVIYVLTHDSIFVGEDGPTHEPVEHYAALRAIPNLAVIRPADGPETAVAWAVALQRQTGPTALLLTRQTLKTVNADEPFRALGLQRGAYILQDCEGAPDLVLVATGSEVGLAVQAAASLGAQGRRVRVVSLPCWELFDAQPPEYREQVIPPGARRVAIESGVSQGWCKYIGTEGLMIGVERFGASAPSKVLAEKYGLTAEQVIARIEGWLTGPG